MTLLLQEGGFAGARGRFAGAHGIHSANPAQNFKSGLLGQDFKIKIMPADGSSAASEGTEPSACFRFVGSSQAGNAYR
jgi:hypothetical protein